MARLTCICQQYMFAKEVFSADQDHFLTHFELRHIIVWRDLYCDNRFLAHQFLRHPSHTVKCVFLSFTSFVLDLNLSERASVSLILYRHRYL